MVAETIQAATLNLFVADGNPLWKTLAHRRSVKLKPIFAKLPYLLHVWEQLVFPFSSRNHLCLNCVGTAPFLIGVDRQIMVVHDINYILLPAIFSRPYRLWAFFSKRLAAKRARKLICFSHYVKKTLVDHLRIAPEKIKVIYQGPGLDNALLHPLLEWERKDPYFICVGSLQPHKNLPRILEAWEHVHAHHPGFELKIIGCPQKNFRGRPSLEPSSNGLKVEFTGYISDEQLAALYRSATGLIYPSLEEGFGLPIVEAFYLGCPVITSNTSCLPEIAGDAALCVDPYSTESIANAVLRLIEDDQQRRNLILRGMERKKLFCWEEAGEKICAELEPLFVIEP